MRSIERVLDPHDLTDEGVVRLEPLHPIRPRVGVAGGPITPR
jgi:hypothetical protein